MSLIIPYSFTAGTKARADEVNANFTAVSQAVNTNATNISTNTSDISDLQSSKANLNGSSTTRFKAANPVDNTDVVNKQTLINSISNSIDIIYGFIITKDSGSPNDTILISEGSCYDTTHTVILKTTQEYTASYSGTQGATTRYNVYVVEGSTVPSFYVSQTAPVSGKYREIGYYYTDSDGNINAIYSYGESKNNVRAVEFYQSTSSASGYIIYSNGYCEQWGIYDNGTTTDYLEKTVDLLLDYNSTDYLILISIDDISIGSYGNMIAWRNRTASSFGFKISPKPDYHGQTQYVCWKTSGFIN